MIQGDFFIGRFPVTMGQYASYCASQKKAVPARPGWFQDLCYPIVNVSVQDAELFCHWAGLELPSEKEWEKAARGINGSLGPRRRSGSQERAAPTRAVPDEKYASPFGLQRIGNVWEITSDWLKHPSPQAAYRVVRGGSYRADPEALTVLARHRVTHDFVHEDIGFRAILRTKLPKSVPNWKDIVLGETQQSSKKQASRSTKPTKKEKSAAEELFTACKNPFVPEQSHRVERLLIGHPNGVHWLDNDGYTPLLRLVATPGIPLAIAAPQIAQELVNAGADINAQTPDGATALHILASHAQQAALEIAALLVDAGADTSLRDSRGETSQMVAKRWRHVYGDAMIAILNRSPLQSLP